MTANWASGSFLKGFRALKSTRLIRDRQSTETLTDSEKATTVVMFVTSIPKIYEMDSKYTQSFHQKPSFPTKTNHLFVDSSAALFSPHVNPVSPLLHPHTHGHTHLYILLCLLPSFPSSFLPTVRKFFRVVFHFASSDSLSPHNHCWLLFDWLVWGLS